MSRLNRRTWNADRDQASLVESDEGEKQSDAHRKAVAQRCRHTIDDPLPQPQDGHHDKQNAGDEDGGQCGLPAKTQQLANRESNERVFAHVRRDGERTIGVERHQVAAECSHQHRRHERWTCGNSGGRENGWIDYHNVRHGSERRQAGNHLAPQRGAMAIEIEHGFQPVQAALRKEPIFR